MTYIIIGIIVIIILYALGKRSAKKRNNPENRITYFYQALELEYFKLNPNSKMDAEDLDKSFLVAAGYFYSLGESGQLSLDEILLLSTYAIEKWNPRESPIYRQIVAGNKALGLNIFQHFPCHVDSDRLIYFIILYKVALQFKENNKDISIENKSNYLAAVDEFDGTKAIKIIQLHLIDVIPPVGWIAVTKRAIREYPDWVELDFS